MLKEWLGKKTNKLFDFSNASHVSISVVLKKFRLPRLPQLFCTSMLITLHFTSIFSSLLLICIVVPLPTTCQSNIKDCLSLQDNTASLPFITSAVFSLDARTHFSLLTSQVTRSHKNVIFVPSLYTHMCMPVSVQILSQKGITHYER